MSPKDLAYLLSFRIGLAPMRFQPTELEQIRARLADAELIEFPDDKKTVLTERGNVYLNSVLTVDLPVKAWVSAVGRSES